MNKKVDTVKLISAIAAALVFLLAVLAFVLSYSSLQHMAQTNGIAGRLSYLWPLLLDFAMIVFSLAILRANLRAESATYPWLLTIAFSGLATVANILDVTTLGIPAWMIAASVKALAPVALVLAFELLMGMIRAEIKRGATVTGIAELIQQQAAILAETEQARQTLAQLAGQRDEAKADLDQIRREKRRELKQPPTDATQETKDKALAVLRESPQISGADLGRKIGKSPRLGQMLKLELEPVVTQNGHNAK